MEHSVQLEKQFLQAEEKLEELKLTHTFRQTKSFVLTSKNEKYIVNQFLFKYNSINIYQRLFDPSIDFHLLGRLEYLVELVKKKTIRSSKFKNNDAKEEAKEFSLIKFELEKKKRRNSIENSKK